MGIVRYGLTVEFSTMFRFHTEGARNDGPNRYDYQILFQIYRRVKSGEIFGEIGVLSDRPQPFTFHTTELSQLLRLSKSSLMNAIKENLEDGTIVMNNFFQVNLLHFHIGR